MSERQNDLSEQPLDSNPKDPVESSESAGQLPVDEEVIEEISEQDLDNVLGGAETDSAADGVQVEPEVIPLKETMVPGGRVKPSSEKSKKLSPAVKPLKKNNKYGSRPFAVPPAKSSRNMLYLVILLAVMLLGFMAFAAFMMHKTKKHYEDSYKSKIDKLNKEISASNASWVEKTKQLEDDQAKLKSKYGVVLGDFQRTQKERDDLTQKNEGLENDLSELGSKKEDLDEKLNETSSLLEETKNNLGEVIDRNTRLIGEKVDLENLKEKIEQELEQTTNEYEVLVAEAAARAEAAEARRLSDEAEYKKYKTSALNIIGGLNKVNDLVVTGVNFTQFKDLIRDLNIDFEEFKISISGEASNYSRLSFQLIATAMQSYQESLDRWRRLIRFSNIDEIGDLREKKLKYEMPIVQQRPWLDTIKILWQQAALATQGAGILVESREKFDPAKCVICHGNHYLNCPKCDHTGECLGCEGKGLALIKGTPVCVLCEGSGKCGLCHGKGAIPCPICLRAGRAEKPPE